MNPEWVGYLASVVTVISLVMTAVMRLRIINLIAVTIWAAYGYLISAPAVVVANVVLMGVNAYFLLRLLTAKEFFHLVEVRKDAVYLAEFLKFFLPQIRKQYPDFEYNPQANVYTFFAMRNVTAAALFIVELREENELYLKLDFTIPGFRDMKVSNYVYAPDSPVLATIRERGFDSVYADEPGEKSIQKYLAKVGFSPDETRTGRWKLALQ